MTVSTPRGLPRHPVAATGVLRLFVVCVCAASAGVHAALTADHLHESTALGVAFALSAGALAAAGVIVRDPGLDSWAPRAAGSVLALIAIAYVASRTGGIPWLVPHPESPGALGLAATASELAAALAATSLIPRKARP